jgi:hypothetical protein
MYVTRNSRLADFSESQNKHYSGYLFLKHFVKYLYIVYILLFFLTHQKMGEPRVTNKGTAIALSN